MTRFASAGGSTERNRTFCSNWATVIDALLVLLVAERAPLPDGRGSETHSEPRPLFALAPGSGPAQNYTHGHRPWKSRLERRLQPGLAGPQSSVPLQPGK